MQSMCIITAWHCISLEVTVQSFKKCCLSNALDGTYGDSMQIGSKEDGNVSTECEEEAGTDFKDRDIVTDWQRQTESDMLCVLSV